MTNTTLTELNLSGDEQELNEKEGNENEKRNKWTDNNIGDEGSSAISETLKFNTTLTKLCLHVDE